MKCPPYLMRLRINNRERQINLWLPLFIILPIIGILIIAFLLILLPFILIATLALWHSGWGKSLLMVFPAAFGCICALRGLEVDFKQNEERVYISFR